MAKHTPGPWIAWDDGRTVGIESADGEPIAILEIVDHGDMADPAQIAADQMIAAAAPDLLAACEAVLAEFPALDSKRIESVKRICREAIAKAGGLS